MRHIRNKTSLYQHTIELEVPFYDVDSMRIVWHGNYFKYFERAREALLKKIGFGYAEMFTSGYLFPVVDSAIKFVRPLQFEERFTVTTHLLEYENRLRLYYLIQNMNHEKMTEGETTQVAVEKGSQSLSFVMPEVFIANVEEVLNL